MTILIDAEAMSRSGFDIVSGQNASGGQLVRANSDNATLSTNFTGETGTYDLTVNVQDESDGKSEIDIVIDGVVIDTIVLDNDNDGSGSDNGGFSAITFEGLTVPEGATVELVFRKDNWEFARIDSIEFTPVATAAAATTSNAATAADPAIVTALDADVTLQAEDAGLSSGMFVTNGNPGAVGAYVDYTAASGAAITWTVDAARDGGAQIDIRYALGSSTPRVMALEVNGTIVDDNLAFTGTGGWTSWDALTLDIDLAAGPNEIRLVATGDSGPNIDELTVRALDVPPPPAPDPDPAPVDPDPAPASDPAILDARDDMFTLEPGEDITAANLLDGSYPGAAGDDDDVMADLAPAGTTVVAVAAAGGTVAPGAGVGSSFMVTTALGREGTVSVDADGNFTFEGGFGFNEFEPGFGDTVELSYTIEVPVEALEEREFDIPDRVPDPVQRFVLVADEEFIDNDISTIEQAAAAAGVTPGAISNDNSPTENGNPPFLWNQIAPGATVRLPTGQFGDDGVFALPTELIGKNGQFSLADFVEGTVRQDRLDEVRDVTRLRNPDLSALAGQSFVAIVYDSDISINYGPLQANLQGARLGAFYFTVEEALNPGLNESGSSSSLNDLVLTVDPVPTEDFEVAGLLDLLNGTAPGVEDNAPDYTITPDTPVDGTLILDFDNVGSDGGSVTIEQPGGAVTVDFPGGTDILEITDLEGATSIQIELAGEGDLVDARSQNLVQGVVTDTANITIVVEEPPLPPVPNDVIANNDSFELFFDDLTPDGDFLVFNFGAPQSILVNDIDPEGDNISVNSVGSDATLDGGVFGPVDGSIVDASLVNGFVGEFGEILVNTDGSFQFRVSNADVDQFNLLEATASTQFIYEAIDDNPVPDTDDAVITITVTPESLIDID